MFERAVVSGGTLLVSGWLVKGREGRILMRGGSRGSRVHKGGVFPIRVVVVLPLRTIADVLPE